jgi:outer membrane protein TolC
MLAVTLAMALSLPEALERSKAAAPNLARLRALESAAAASVDEARAARRPGVDLQAGYTRQSNVPEYAVPQPDGSLEVIFPNIPDNWVLRAQTSVPLYTGGRLTGQREAAEHRRDAATGEVATGTLDILYETTEAYWDLVTARERVRVLTLSLAAYEQHLVDARHRESLGLAPRSEALTVQVERDQAELARVQAENAAAVAEANLARLVDLPPGTPIEPSEPLDGAAAHPEPLETLVEAALAARPERKSLDARRLALEKQADVERAARLPQLLAAAGYDYNDPNRRIVPVQEGWEDSWDVSLRASFQAYDGGRSKAAATRYRSEAEGVAHQLDDFDRRVRLDVTARRLGVDAARRGADVATRAEAAAAEAERIVKDRYLEGVATNAERLDAEVALQRARLDRTAALAQWRVAGARLDRAVGR